MQIAVCLSGEYVRTNKAAKVFYPVAKSNLMATGLSKLGSYPAVTQARIEEYLH